jgi:predicted ester cyclase
MRTLSQDLRDFASRYTKAWCQHDAAAVASFHSPNSSLTINNGEPAIGRDAITVSARAFMIDFPDLHVSMDDLVMEGNQVKYLWTLTGTNTGPAGTGKKVRIRGFELWKIGDDGLIASSTGHFDEAEYQRQLRGLHNHD